MIVKLPFDLGVSVSIFLGESALTTTGLCCNDEFDVYYWLHTYFEKAVEVTESRAGTISCTKIFKILNATTCSEIHCCFNY